VPKSTSLTDPNLIALVRLLNQSRTPLYRYIAQRIQTPRRKRTAINVGKLERYTETSDTVIVPGKVLAAGRLEHQLTVAALNFSEHARKQIENANGICMTIAELVEKNPSAKGIKILI